MQGIHLLAGLVRRNGSQCLLREGGLVDDTPGDNALISTGVACPCQWRASEHHRRTSKTLVAYEAQLIMYCPQVVDDGPLVLSVFAAPWAVSITSAKCQRALGS